MAESERSPEGILYYGETWSFADMDELRLHCETGGTVEGAATLLSRTLEEVWRKARELQVIK